jgi:hypothetical protein
MKTRLQGVWTAARLATALAAAALRRRRERVEPGLNTEADAEAFVEAMHAIPEVVVEPSSPHPIFDELMRELPIELTKRFDLPRRRTNWHGVTAEFHRITGLVTV